MAATNNLNFGNPERPEIMAQLVEAIEGIAEACRFFETPITGGNVSLYNETLGEGIYPTPVLGIVGLMKTADAGDRFAFKNAGRTVMLLGGIGDCDDTRFGGTRIRQGDSERALGTAAGARYGLREARAGRHARDRRRGTGGIGARSERWRPGGGAGRMLRTDGIGAQRAISIATCGRSSLLFHEAPVAHSDLHRERRARRGNCRAVRRANAPRDRRYNERAVTRSADEP